MSKDFLWCEKYRPKTISETILPKALKDTFQKMVESGEIQNMIFSGTPWSWQDYCSEGNVQ